MEFGILGSFQVSGPDGPAQLGGAKRRGLLAYLVVHAGQEVSPDRLVESLWGEESSSGARGTVQTYVSQLRKVLATSDDDAIETRSGGYVLDVPARHVDAARFERLCAQAAAEQDPRRRLEDLEEAMVLWRGPPLAEFAGAEWADLETTRLEALHLQALQQRLDVLLSLGRHAEALPDLERLVGDYPLDERFWAQLMLAYYRAGRQADALQAYQQVRSVLADELGIEPGTELTELEHKVLDQDPALEDASREVAEAWTTVAPSIDVAVPFPVRLAPPRRLVGRASEHTLLESAWKHAATGEQRLVLIAGEPGIGKTALAAQFGAEAGEEGALVLYGRCDEELRASYRPFIEALQPLVGSMPDEALRDHVAEHGADLSRLVPELARRLPEVAQPLDIEADTERYALFDAVVSMFSMATARQPILFVLDDLQWADKSTLMLIRHLVTSAHPLKLLLAVTYRDTELSTSNPLTDLLAVLRPEPRVERIALGGLNDDEVLTLVATEVEEELDDSGAHLAHEISRETGGNPFFVTEVLRHLMESGAVSRQPDRAWPAAVDFEAAGLPDSINEVVGRRVQRLGEDAGRVLTSAAVIGREFDFELLTLVTERSEEDLLDILDAADRAAIVRETPAAPGHYTFAHSLIQHTLYEDLGAMRRQRAHQRVAEALEELCGDDPSERVWELAYHWASATKPAEAEKAIRYARRAAERSLDALAPDEAIRWLEQALDLLDQLPAADDQTRCRLLIGLGVAQRHVGMPESRETLLTAGRLARQTGDHTGLVQAALANTRGQPSFTTRGDAERIEIIEAALSALDTADSPERARLLALLAVELAFSDGWQRRRTLSDEAVHMARRLDDPMSLVRVLNMTFHAVYAPQTLALRTRWAAEATRLSRDIGEPALRWTALSNRMWASVDAGNFEEVDRLIGEQDTITHRLDEPFLRFDAAFLRAIRSIVADTISESDDALERLREVGSAAGIDETDSASGALSFAIASRRGESAETFIDAIDEAAAALPDLPATRSAMAACYCDAGRSQEASALLEAEVHRGFDAVPYDRIWLCTMAHWARVASALKSKSAAETLMDVLLPYREQFLGPHYAFAEGAVSQHLGGLATALGHYKEAERYFDEADHLYDRIGSVFLVNSNKLARGRMHSDRGTRGDMTSVAKLLDEVLAASGSEGYAGLDRQAAALRRDATN